MTVNDGTTRERVFDAISDFIANNGFSPTYAEIGKAVGIGRTSVNHHVHKLRDANRITFLDNETRTIQIVGSDNCKSA